MGESCLSPVEPCYSPSGYHTVAEVEQRRYRGGEEIHGAEIPGEEIHDVTWVEELEGQDCWGRMTGSLG